MKPAPASLTLALLVLGAVAWGAIAKNRASAKTIPELYEVLAPRNEKKHAISTLSTALNSQDAAVSLTAAELLLALGDESGVPVLRHTASNPKMAEHLRIQSLALLDQYGIYIDYAQIHALYEATKNPDLVRIMAMQRHAEAAPIIADLHQNGKAGGSYYFLGHVDGAGRYTNEALAAFNAVDGRERGEAGLYLFLTTKEDRFLSSVLAIPGEDLRLMLLGVKSVMIRDRLRNEVAALDATIASEALVSLYYIQEDQDFLDTFIIGRLETTDPGAGFHAKAFWRIVARRAKVNERISSLVKTRISNETRNAYFLLDAEFVNAYWIVAYLPYRSLRLP